MSDPKLISPLLDGFAIGAPMSSHDGILCCPAIKENSDNKYIVKIISIPASQTQLDAFLLTGAYKDPAEAVDYFREIAEGVVKEAEILNMLSRLEGFLPYSGCQIVPMEDGRLGYQVYLVSSYKRSLEKYMRRNVMTHLEAVNLGLDLCHALAICRKAGYLYVDLKPGNIFISRDKEYRIGDLGFVSLDALPFTSLPGKYISAYSAPEAQDAMKTLNETMDTYALGMILYQIYNDGNLPTVAADPTEPYLPPVNADYEIAEIILKAISPDPASRWQNPMSMGQALVAYMQRNSVNKTPITPKTEINTDGVALEDIADTPEPAPAAEIPVQENAPTEQPDTITEETDPQPEPAPSIPVEPELPRMPEEEEVQPENPVSVSVTEPDVIQPPVNDVTEPDEEDEFLFSLKMELDASLEPAEAEPPQEPMPEQEPASQPSVTRKERKKRKSIGTAWIGPLAGILVLAALICGGLWFYQNHYLQTIDSMTIDGSQNTMIVSVQTNADSTLLNVICTDTYGNTLSKPLTDGQAVFTDLLPNSQYKVRLEINGFHKLVGKTTDMFNTDAQINVLSFTAGIGPEDGSAIVTLTVEGGEPEAWNLTWQAEGEEAKSLSFSGRNATIKGLTVGKVYTFLLDTEEDIQLTGQTQMEYTAAKIVMAENVHVTSISEGKMTVRWDVPADAIVESWFIRCYDTLGNEQTQEVAGNSASFSGIDTAQSYTVEVTAAGMTQPSRTSITANPITVTGLNVDDSDPNQLTVTWEFEGTAPEGGWLLMYGFAGSDKQSVMKCSTASVVITPRVPSATYLFSLQAADSTTVFGREYSYTTPKPEIFADAGLTAESITGHLLKTPDGEWSFESEGKESFSDSFRVGDKLSLVLHSKIGFYLPEQEMEVLYVFRDENGSVLPDQVVKDTIIWKDLWYDGDYHYGELDIPTAPEEAGSYSLSLYFDNAAVIYITFTIQ